MSSMSAFRALLRAPAESEPAYAWPPFLKWRDALEANPALEAVAQLAGASWDTASEMAARSKFWAGGRPFELETRTWIREQAGLSPAQIRDAYDPEDTNSLSRAIVADWVIDEVSRA